MIYNLHCNSCSSFSPASWLLHTSLCRTAPSCIKWFSIPTRHCLSSLGSWCQMQLAEPLVRWLCLCADLLYAVPAVDWFRFGRAEKYFYCFFSLSPSFCSSSYWPCLATWSRQPPPGWIPVREEKMDLAPMGQQKWMESLQKCPGAHS